MLVPQAQYAKSKLEFWVLKTEYSKQLMDTALRWESTNITSKFLRIWFERLQVAHLLEDTAEDFEVESISNWQEIFFESGQCIIQRIQNVTNSYVQTILRKGA